jgi:hypothetical protein
LALLAVRARPYRFLQEDDARGGQAVCFPKDLVAVEEPQNVLQYIPALDEATLDSEELRPFVIKNDRLSEHEFHRSQWIKMATL